MTTAGIRLRAVLFDAAGTLIELREPVGETYGRTAREFGVDLPAWRLDDAFARILARAPARVFPEALPEEIEACERSWWRDVVRSTFLAADSTTRFADFDAFFDRLYRVFSDSDVWRCRDGCHAALRALRTRGLLLGVVSNFDRRLPALLDALDLGSCFDVVVLPSDAGAEKPDPRIFAFALDRLRVGAADAVYVGDSHTRDLAGARAAGMRAIDAASLATLEDLPGRLTAGIPPHRSEPA